MPIPTDPIFTSKAVTQYLSKYAEAESRSLPAVKPYDYCLVIPAFDESWSSLQQVWQNQNTSLLVVLVINSPLAEHKATLALLHQVEQQAHRHTRRGNCNYLEGDQDILVVDRCSQDNILDPRKGVGLARKIGADIALRLIAEGNIKSRLIFCTDADAILPREYLQQPFTDQDAALTYPFLHRASPGLEKPTLLYEISLLYYANGLQWAGSNYAYTCLGSALAVNASHYAKVRGFPQRAAAEDFYLLNKLTKTGLIRCVNAAPIILKGRLSDRVPVGTGPAIRRIMEMTGKNYTYYHPQTFIWLKEFLCALNQLWNHPDALTQVNQEIEHYCRALNVTTRFTLFRRHTNSQIVFEKALHDWFDGFRSLKFIHFMRDHYAPSVPLMELGGAEFIDTDLLPNLEATRDALLSRLHGDQSLVASG